MSFQQPELPYAINALEPYISQLQMSFHYGKHHAAYFKNLNALVEGTPQSRLPLERVIVESDGGVLNNAAQAWNHSFLWNCMTPSGGGGQPTGELSAAIRRDFGSFEAFKEAFTKAAVTLFGSGWAWLAAGADGKLEILALGNAGTPLKEGKRPLLTIDVWEHAYYLDYKNERPRFVEGFWNVVNWEFVFKNLQEATGH
jgi:Fe-Mn family superoxide dismutase